MKIKNEEPSKMQSDVYRKFGSVEEILVNNIIFFPPVQFIENIGSVGNRKQATYQNRPYHRFLQYIDAEFQE